MITLKFISLGFLCLGIFFLMQIILPLVSFQIWEIGINSEGTTLVSPQNFGRSNVLGVSIQNDDDFSYFVSNVERKNIPNYLEFTISIPKLKIEKKEVFVDSNDITSGLAHLPASALPGEKGNVFISGHSAINFFKGIKNAPFANLQDLKKGDQIEIFAGGAEFLYEVVELRVVKPSDLSVINPPESLGRYITLMTCVPPGLNLKRLVVVGKLI